MRTKSLDSILNDMEALANDLPDHDEDLGIDLSGMESFSETVRERYGRHVSTLEVYIIGRDEMVGAIVCDSDGPTVGPSHGTFVYAENYDGPPLSPSLDYRQNGRTLELTQLALGNERYNRDLHSVFEQTLPDDYGTRILSQEIPGYDQASALERLAILSGTKEQGGRLGSFRFVLNTSAASEFTPLANLPIQGQDALDRVHSKITAFAHKNAAELQLAGINFGEDELWAASCVLGQTPKVIYRSEDGNHYFAKISATELWKNAAHHSPAIERATTMAAINANITVPDQHLLTFTNGDSILMSKRFDIDQEANAVRYKVAASVMLDRKKYARTNYSELMDLVDNHSHQPDIDRVALFQIMTFNAMANNTDDHAGQIEFMHSKDGWSLAPAFDLVADLRIRANEHGNEKLLDHMAVFPSGERSPPNFDGDTRAAGKWYMDQAEILGMDANVARDVITQCAVGVAGMAVNLRLCGAPEHAEAAKRVAELTGALDIARNPELAVGQKTSMKQNAGPRPSMG